jgi:hypothetical protein
MGIAALTAYLNSVVHLAGTTIDLSGTTCQQRTLVVDGKAMAYHLMQSYRPRPTLPTTTTCSCGDSMQPTTTSTPTPSTSPQDIVALYPLINYKQYPLNGQWAH